MDSTAIRDNYLLNRRLLFPYVMLALLCVVWGLTFPATKAALETTSPMHFLALRFLVATVVLTPFIFLRKQRFRTSNPSQRVPGRGFLEWKLGALIGLILLVGFTLQVIGMRYTTASRSGFFTSLLIILTPIFAALFRTSRTSGAVWLGLVPAVAGIYLLADPETGGLNFGDWLTIGCAVAFALQMVVLEAVAKHVRDTWTLTYAQIIVVAVGALLWSVIEGRQFDITSTGVAAAVYTGLFGSIAAVWLQTRYQPEVPAGHAALIFTLEPVFASIFAWLLLGDTWTLRGLAGAAAVLLGMVLSGTVLARKGRFNKMAG